MADFIALEGIDGSGKSTQIRRLADALRAVRCGVATVRVPGTTELGLQMRRLLCNSRMHMTPLEQLLLFTTARLSIGEQVKTLLQAGHHVLADRWTLSSLVYQCQEDVTLLAHYQSLQTMLPIQPALTIVLDVPVELACQRMLDQSLAGETTAEEVRFHNRFESVGVQEMQRRCDRYRKWAELLPDTILLDGTLPEESLTRLILKECQRRNLLGD